VRHEQLEQERAVALAQPVRQRREARGLAAVQLRVAASVVADEHLRVGRVEVLDVPAEVGAELEVELVAAALLDGHRERETALARTAGDAGAELLVDEEAGGALVDAVGDGELERVVDHALGVRDALLAAEELRERGAMVEGEHVQVHRGKASSSEVRTWSAP